MTKLTPTQMKVLTNAAARRDGNVEPLPAIPKGGARAKAIDALMKSEMITERDSGVFITPLGLETIGGVADADELVDAPDAAAAPDVAPECATRGRKAKIAPEARASRKAAQAAPTSIQRPGSKQSALIHMLRQPQGASIDEIAAEFSWQKHTVRGAISGALRNKLGLDVQSEKVDGRGTVYRLA